MSLAKVTEEWVPLQIKVFTRWVNGQLKGVIANDLDDITKDLASGVHLVELAQVLTQKTVPRWNKDPKRNVFMVQNCDIAIDAFTKDGIQLVGISGKDINDCNVKLILGLIWTLILNYSIGKSIETEDANQNSNQGSSRNALLQWAIERTSNYPNVNNFQPYDLSMCALLDSYVPEKINYNSLSTDDIEKNANTATNVMNELGIPVYIYPDDVVKSGNKVDEKTLLTQLAAAKVVLDNLPPRTQERSFNLEDEEAERLAREKEEAERLAREKEEAERLARQNAGNDDVMSIIEQLRRELADVRNQLNDANDKIDESNERLNGLEKENDSLRKSLSCLKYEVKKLKDAHRTPENSPEALSNQGEPNWVISGERSAQQGNSENNSTEINQLRNDVDQYKNSLQNENEQLRKEVQNLQSELQNLNGQVQTIPRNSTSVPEDLIQKVNQCSETNQRLEQLQNEHNSINEALTNLKQEVEKIKEDTEHQNNNADAVPNQHNQTWVISQEGSQNANNNDNTTTAQDAPQKGCDKLRHDLDCLKYEVKKLKRAQKNNQ